MAITFKTPKKAEQSEPLATANSDSWDMALEPVKVKSIATANLEIGKKTNVVVFPTNETIQKQIYERLRSALYSVTPSDYDTVLHMSWGGRALGLHQKEFNDWSGKPGWVKKAFDSDQAGKKAKTIGPGTFFQMANDAGWFDPNPGLAHLKLTSAPKPPTLEEIEQAEAEQEAKTLEFKKRFDSYPVAPQYHEYLKRKGGTPHHAAFKVVPDDSTYVIRGQCVAGYLVIPIRDFDGMLVSAQFISPTIDATTHSAIKRFPAKTQPGKGLYFVENNFAKTPDQRIYIVEGPGHLWTLWDVAYDSACACAFGVQKLKRVAHAVRDRYPHAQIVIVSDRGEEAAAEKAAQEVDGFWVALPESYPEKTDINDVYDLLYKKASAEFSTPEAGPEAREAVRELLSSGLKKAPPLTTVLPAKVASKAAIEKAAAEAIGAAHGVQCPGPFPGPMTVLTELGLAYQNRRQPILAMAAALAGMSACMHSRYAHEDGLRANNYFVGLAGTSAGKNEPLRFVKTLLDIAGVNYRTSVASGAGLEDAIACEPTKRVPLLIDEVGHTLGAITSDKSADYLTDTARLLLEYHSASSSTITVRPLATRHKAKLSDNEPPKPPEKIIAPYVTLYGTANFSTMNKLPAKLVADGTLNRTLIFVGNDYAPTVEDMPEGRLYPELRKAIEKDALRVARFKKYLSTGFEAISADAPMTDPEDGVRFYPMTPEAHARCKAYGRQCDAEQLHADEAKRGLCGRALEQVKRVALTLCVWDDADAVSLAHVEWSIRLVCYCHASLLGFVSGMSDSKPVQDAKRVLGYMRDAVLGKKPFTGANQRWNKQAEENGYVSRGALMAKTSLTKQPMNEAIDFLMETGVIDTVLMQGKTKGGTFYVIVATDEEG
jgi:hypothetical protein